MRFGCFAQLSVVAVAIAAGLGELSLWWLVIPIFLASSLSISNGPGFDIVMKANKEGRLGVFPRMFLIHCFSYIILAATIYWVTSTLR